MSATPLTVAPSRKPPLVTLVLVVAILYLAKEVLIPLALAILISFALGPSVRRLERRGLWRGASVALVAGLFFLTFAGITWLVVNQAVDLAGKLPTYQNNIVRKLQGLRGPGGNSLSQAAKAVEDINKKLGDAAPATGGDAAQVPVLPGPRGAGQVLSSASAGATETAPLAVRIIEPTLSPTKLLGNLAGPLLGPLGTAGVVVVFTIFLLIQREDLRDRLLHIIGGSEQLSVTTQAVDEAGKRVSKYLLMQAAINATTGVLLGLGLWAIGVPNAALWGLLMAALRFIPFLGAPIAAAFPLLLSLAVFENWRPLVLTVALLVVLELTMVNVVEPMLFSGSAGVTSLAIIVAATFWTWLWGPVGLLLATPLTVCIVVLGRYVPSLGFIHTLLGDEPVLPADARLYQRFLGADQEAVVELVDEHLETHSPAELYDQMLIPALNQAQTDIQGGKLSEERVETIRQTTSALLEEVRERFRPPPAVAAAENAPRVIILPAKNVADETAGHMLAHVLALNGIPSKALSAKLLAQEMLDAVAASEVSVVCVSTVRPFAVMHARYLCKRLRTNNPDLKIVIGLWDAKNAPDTSRRSLQGAADAVDTTVVDAADAIRQLLPPEPPAETSAAPAAADAGPRLFPVAPTAAATAS